jgi:hypothetical protein
MKRPSSVGWKCPVAADRLLLLPDRIGAFTRSELVALTIREMKLSYFSKRRHS